MALFFNNPAPIDSPAFTGVPTAPTQPPTDESTKLATTAFVAEYIRQQPLLFDGVSIGTPGQLLFGVGPALSGSVPVGVSLSDYYPVHPRTRSYM